MGGILQVESRVTVVWHQFNRPHTELYIADDVPNYMGHISSNALPKKKNIEPRNKVGTICTRNFIVTSP